MRLEERLGIGDAAQLGQRLAVLVQAKAELGQRLLQPAFLPAACSTSGVALAHPVARLVGEHHVADVVALDADARRNLQRRGLLQHA